MVLLYYHSYITLFGSIVWQILGIFSLPCVLIIFTPLFAMILYILDNSSTAFLQFGTRRTWNLCLQLISIISGITAALTLIALALLSIKHDKITACTQSVKELTAKAAEEALKALEESTSATKIAADKASAKATAGVKTAEQEEISMRERLVAAEAKYANSWDVGGGMHGYNSRAHQQYIADAGQGVRSCQHALKKSRLLAKAKALAAKKVVDEAKVAEAQAMAKITGVQT